MANSVDEGVSQVRSAVLRAAGRRLLTGHTFGQGFDYARVGALLEWIEGAPLPDFSGLNTPDRLLLDRLLRGLRSELLTVRGLEHPVASSEELLDLLAAVESVHIGLQKSSQNSFLEILSSHRGPELVVELVHDLRSPLTSVLFLAESLRNGKSGPLNELQHSQLGIIYSAALTLVSMAGDVIELARGNRSLLETEPSPLSLSRTFASVCDLVRPMIENKDVVLETRCPQVDQRLGFPVALNRVLLNLVTNAVKFTERGRIEITATEQDGDRIEFSVRDTGRGIDFDAAKHLFEPFHVNPARDRIGFSGTGLGLSICRRLVRGMGGELEFETAPGAGTRFHFVVALPPS